MQQLFHVGATGRIAAEVTRSLSGKWRGGRHTPPLWRRRSDPAPGFSSITSARKKSLLKAVMSEVQAHFQRSFTEVSRRSAIRRTSVLRTFWLWATRPANLRYFRLLLEVQVLALQNPSRYARYVEKTSASWLDLIEEAMPAGAKSRAKGNALRRSLRWIDPRTLGHRRPAPHRSRFQRIRKPAGTWPPNCRSRSLAQEKAQMTELPNESKQAAGTRELIASRRHTVIFLLILAAISVAGAVQAHQRGMARKLPIHISSSTPC